MVFISCSFAGDRIDADQLQVQVPDPRKNAIEGRLIDHGTAEHRHIPLLDAEGKPVEPLLSVAAQVPPEPYFVVLFLQGGLRSCLPVAPR